MTKKIDKFMVTPYVGALPLQFGMTQSEIENILGKPRKEIKRDSSIIQAFWESEKGVSVFLAVIAKLPVNFSSKRPLFWSIKMQIYSSKRFC